MELSNIKLNKRNADERILTALLIVAAIASAIWAGTFIECPAGQKIIVGSPLSGENKLTDIAFLTLPEIIVTALLSLPMGNIASKTVVFSVFAVRGLAIGHTACFCTVNSVSPAALGAVSAYCAVTLMLAFFAVYISDKKDMGAVSRLLCYFTVSGACAVIRTVPYLFC